MRIHCVTCRKSEAATKRRGTIAGTGAAGWFNVCNECRTPHPAPPPDQAERNHRQRAIVRRRKFLERHGQQTLLKGPR